MKRILKWSAAGCVALALLLLSTGSAFAQETSIDDVVRGVDTIWLIVAAMVVFFMQAGFALLESGTTRSKNSINVLMKNLVDFSFATVAFWAVGYGLMFGTGTPWIGLNEFFVGTTGADVGSTPQLAFWFFQLVFAGTAATIVSGAMAERTKFSAYVIFSIVITALIYPVFGHWTWGGGWLNNLSFIGEDVAFSDFAGSTIVHSVGGWAALMGAIVLGPRIGRFSKDGKSTPIPGHSMPLMALGVFILWIGWFGFNAGSELAAVGGSADAIALIATNTTISAACGALGALIITWMRNGKPDAALSFNGVIGGLVAITAPCASVAPGAAIIIGLVGGGIVVLGSSLLEAMKIDDPVGAVPAHMMAGIWGTLAVAIFPFSAEQLMAQLVGIVACAVWAGGVSYIMFMLLKSTMGIRVSAAEEEQGLDFFEHGAVAYPDINPIPEQAAPAPATSGVSRAPAK